MKSEYPMYKRSPRVIKREPKEKINIIEPPAKEKPAKGQLLRTIVPPLVMLIGTVLMSASTGNYVYALIGGSMTFVTSIFTITAYFTEQKDIKIRNKQREKAYNKYILKVRKDIYHLYEEQKEALLFNSPSIGGIETMIEKHDSRLFERSGNDSDFLCVSVGKGELPISFEISNPVKEFKVEKDELLEEAEELYHQFETQKDMPINIDLKSAHLGLVGEKKIIHEQLKLLISQLTFQHSYHDLEFVILHQENDAEEFDYLRWAPHFTIHSCNVTGMVHNERVRDQVLGSVTQIIKDRKLQMEEEKMETRFLPHIVFIIDEPSLILNHSIMEYLQLDTMKLGFSMIYTTNQKGNLPENVKTIVTYQDSEHGELFMEEGVVKEDELHLNRLGDVDLERMTRNLCPIQHVQGMNSQIPEGVTFFELYNVTNPDEFDINKRWDEHKIYKSIAVPLGLRGEDDIVELNLHEKAHGPHGLVAGTTGSGKSEIVQAYILSLAVNFHPYDVGFLLIDYKGGGMASLFEHLPHLLGTITNLDGAESMRAMASIKSELARRQSIFNEYHVNHIDQYIKLFKNGEATEPLPHLFLISDEFAELKKEQPDFMSELVSAARIGRSLGVHLILATQKPSGVVDDQIWTNSRFKLALKVADASDSQEMLKTADAANITRSGRAYLQVGNNEIYELFQSAWSGAPYRLDDKQEEVFDDRVYLINDLGQGQLLNDDLSVKGESLALEATQLDVTVDHIEQIYETMDTKEVRKTWLPSLGTNMTSPHTTMENIKDVAIYDEVNLQAKIALIDLPEEQKQVEYDIDLLNEGNHLLYAAPGFGKSTFLTTIATSLAIKNSAQWLHLYIFDFGNAALISLKDLPHTADYFTYDELDKIYKFVAKMEDEMRNRKKAFAASNAINFEMYNKVAKEKIPAIVVMIDNYDVIKELDPDLEDFIAKLTRDGVGLGIITLVTATSTNAMRYAIVNNFKHQMVMYLFDPTEATAIVGRTEYPLGEIPGRTLIKIDNVNQMQVYQAVEGETSFEYVEHLQQWIQSLKDQYTGDTPESIPMLPEELGLKQLTDMADITTPYMVPVGLDVEDVKPQYLDLSQGHSLIIGDSQSGKTNLLRLVLEHLLGDAEIYFVDSKQLEFSRYQDQIHYINSGEGFDSMLEELGELIESRKNEYEDAKLEDQYLLPKDFYKQLDSIAVLIEDCDNFVELADKSESLEVENIVKGLTEVGIYLVGTSLNNKLGDYGEVASFLKESNQGIILCHTSEQNIYNVPYEAEKKVMIDRGTLYNNGNLVEIQIPKVEGGDDDD